MRRLFAAHAAHRLGWHRLGALAATCGLVAASGIVPGCTPDFPINGMPPGQVIITDPVGPVDCDTVSIGQSTLPVFESSGLTGAFTCASCHNAGTPTARDIGWGPDGDLTPAGWHNAVLQLAAAEEVTDVTAHTLYTHFNGSDATHPVNAAALADMETWLNSFLDNGGTACGGGISCDLDAILADTSDAFVTAGLTAEFGCAVCHNSGSPAARDQAWGPNNDLSDAGWQLAVATLALAEPAALEDIPTHTLYTHFDGSDGTHPVSAAGKAGIESYLGAFIAAGGLSCVGAVGGDGDGDGDGDPIIDNDNDGIDDAIDNCLGLFNPLQTDTNNSGVGDDCDPLCMGNTIALPDETQARDKFAELGLPAYYTCATCHDSGTPEGTAQGWGPGAGDYYDAVIGLLTREGELDLPGEQADIARYWSDPPPTVHTANAAARQALITFLDYRNTEQAIPLEECLAPGGDGDGDGDGCTPLPVGEADSLSYWNELDVAAHFSAPTNCAQCHGDSDPTASNIGWGSPALQPNAEEWHYASYTKYGNPPVATVGDIPGVNLVTHFGPATPNDSFHPSNQPADDDVSAWLEYLVTGCKP